MKNRYSLLMILVLGFFTLSGNAQDRRSLETKVADVLTQMPTHDLVHRDRLMEEMISLGEPGLLQFAKMIVAPGTGDDTQARFALSSLAHYVGKGRMEPARSLVANVFVKALEGTGDKAIKSFFLYHLNFFGKEEVVPVLGKYLNDPELVEPAVAFLRSYGSHSSAHVMINALPGLSVKSQTVCVKALGEMRAEHALEAITLLAKTTDINLKKEVLYALANMADPASLKLLSAEAKAADYRYEPSQAAAALLKYAERLGEKGELGKSAEICESLIKKCQGPGQQTYALSAISIRVNQTGYEAMELLLDGIKHPEKHYRGSILRYAAQITDIAATREWMEVYPKLPVEVQAELMNFFGNRGDKLVMPLVQEALKSDNLELKTAGMVSLGKIWGRDGIHALIFAMRGGSEAEVAAAQDVLRTLVGPAEIHLVAESFEKQNAAGQIAVIELLAERQAKEYFNLVLKNTNNEDAGLKKAAYKSLAAVSSIKDLNALMELLSNATTDDFLTEIQNAIVASASQSESDPAEPVLKAFAEAGAKQYRFIGVLPQLGGAKALETTALAFKNGDSKMKDLAFEALTRWQDYSASAVLFDICQSGGGNYQDKAFAGYVRQVKTSDLPADQKLLLLRKLMPYAANEAQKLSVITALNNNKTFLTAVYLGQLMNDRALANEAGRALATIALPPSGTKEGMYGTVVRELLNKALTLITGEESDYIKANIKTWLEQMPEAEGYVPMFNGKDLTGWQGLVKDPIARAKMSEKELAAAQKKADERLPEMWTVVDGEIRFTGSGFENLCSIKEYGDFEMLVDWRINKKGDSGIYLRGTPQVQVWDTSRVEVGAQVGSGGLYNNQKNPSKPLVVADNPINDWNTFYIKMIGERVTVYLNGVLVTDNVVLENYWNRSMAIFPTGPIELQAHGTDLAFRDVYVREIKSEAYNLSVEEQAEGFVALFNGKNLDGWIGNKVDYLVEDGVIVIRPTQGGHGNLYTEKQYGDFNYRFEFKLTPGANNGLGIRTPAEGDAAYLGMELQILDNTAPIYANLQPYQYHGSVYGVIPAKRGFLKPVGEWNSEEVIVQGTRVKVILNGEVIVDGDIADGRDNGTMDHKDHPGLKNTQGHIGFLGHGSVVHFRNIRIKEL